MEDPQKLRCINTCQADFSPTSHEVWVSATRIGDDPSKAKLVHTFKGRTKSGDILLFTDGVMRPVYEDEHGQNMVDADSVHEK